MAEWFEECFGKDYLIVYKHRDDAGAYREVRAMSAWLGLKEGAAVLDLCCGTGRHSLALAKFGYRVTGMDLSEVLLAEARRRDRAGRVRFVRGDMREVPLNEKFDAVVNLFTSFGYFESDADNLKVLAEIRRLLKPAGRFLIDFLNPSYLRRNLAARSERTVDGLRITENRRIEGGFVRKEITLCGPEGRERKYREQVRLYELDDFRSMFGKAGLRLESVYGRYDGSPYDPAASPRMIMIGARKEHTEIGTKGNGTEGNMGTVG